MFLVKRDWADCQASRCVMQGIVLIDQPRTGCQNMALDQRMLEQAATLEQVLLRIYQWSSPTLSLGYFQKYAERLTHPPSQDIDVVRRSTGGGAIVHHHDWTYSVAVPQKHASFTGRRNAEIGASRELYDSVHSEVIGWLAEQGLTANMHGQHCDIPGGRNSKCSFLCFERRNIGDVVAHGQKLMGSAQRRHEGALLQHGSLLLTRSSCAPSLSGCQELCDTRFGKTEFRDFGMRIARALSTWLGVQFDEVEEVEHLVKGGVGDCGKYEQTTWTGRA